MDDEIVAIEKTTHGSLLIFQRDKRQLVSSGFIRQNGRRMVKLTSTSYAL